MESDERKALVIDLYGLRAGLSAVSVERGELDAYKQSIEEQIESGKKQLQKLSEERESIRKERVERQNAINDAKRCKEKAASESRYRADRAQYGKDVAGRIFLRILGFVIIPAVIAGIAVLIEYFLIKDNLADEGFGRKVAGWIFVIVIAAVGLGLEYLYFKKGEPWDWGTLILKPESKEQRAADVLKNTRIIEDNENALKGLELAMKRNNETYPQIEQRNKELPLELQQGMLPFTARSSAVYIAVKKQYGELLDERDWENLDYIIYTIETKRADSIKEALQQVDMERRKNEIVAAVGEAARAVSDTIRQSYREMQQNMVKCFQVISLQIDKAMTEQNAKLDALSDSVSSLSGSISQLSGSIDLQNALLSKANTSSLQLFEDVKYMRDMAENREVRRRAGV